VWPLVFTLLFLLVQCYLAPHSTLDVDSVWYAKLAYQYLGHSPQEAHHLAEMLWCTTDTNPDCTTVFAHHLPPSGAPRYIAIFDTRPGYPLAIAGLTTIIGNLRLALWIIPVACTLLAGLGVYWLLRLLGLVPALAATGQVLYYVLPTGILGVHALTEGPITAGAIAVILGGVLLSRGRFALGTVLLVIGLGSMAVIKYSTALPLASLALLAAIVCWRQHDADRRGLAVLGGISALTVAIVLYISSKFALPGFSDTAQDLFTNHFAKPDVPDVMQRMIGANESFWAHFLTVDTNNLLLLAGLVVGLTALFRYHRVGAALVLATVLTGFALAVAHPDPLGGVRLYLLAWVGVVIGAPVFAHRAIGNRQPKLDEAPATEVTEVTEAETQQFSLVEP
jgi:hypothetical protein